ncbi:hypothetical protein SS50377_24554 [Spironucleus salmonicida]|uniref:Uncharacterized protein n=1 Tax=Spironucleus salmonicida TaxID=348837 RepID=A0A9P8RZD9_9EUKA|nr:hypothetical protein SS50377_24554 [Spironucleus salmonicida]
MIPRIPIVTRCNKYHLLLISLLFSKTHPSESSLPFKTHPSLCFCLKQHTE